MIDSASDRREPAPLARGPVLGAMVVVGTVLTVFSARYGYHRDELYFRMLHAGWGYVDQPPLTPLLARLFTHTVADAAWAIRIPATLSVLASIYAVALVTREVGGGRGAQALAAWGYGTAAVPLVMGHALLTSTVDLPVWPLVVLFVLRALLRAEPRWWLATGAVVGVSTYNKLLVAVLLVALAAGLLLVGPRRMLRSRWVGLGALLAAVIALPNLAYQALHSWPQLRMGRALAEHNASDVRVSMWPFLLLMLGPPLVPIWIAGLVALVRRPQWRAIRFVAAAFPVLLVLVFVMGSQNYYPIGLVAVLYAIGCVPAWTWVRRGLRARRPLVVAGVALNAAVAVTLGLPLIPVGSLGDTPVPGINQVARDTVGWPAYVREIAAAYDALPAQQRRHAVVVASNYGEAGAVGRYGARYRLPAVYSGQNALWNQARPPDGATTAIVVGGQVPQARALFGACRVVGRLDNRVGVDNEEQDEPIAVCSSPVGGWRTVWPALRHLD